jgi:hypothetical protein
VTILENADRLRDFIAGGQAGTIITQNRYAAGLAPEIRGDLDKWEGLQQKMPPWKSKSGQKEQWLAWLRGDTGTNGPEIEHAK